jgi:hypothetical protein
MKNLGLTAIDCSILSTNEIVIFHIDYSSFLSAFEKHNNCARGVVFGFYVLSLLSKAQEAERKKVTMHGS